MQTKFNTTQPSLLRRRSETIGDISEMTASNSNGSFYMPQNSRQQPPQLPKRSRPTPRPPSSAQHRLQALSMYLDEHTHSYEAVQPPEAPIDMNYRRQQTQQQPPYPQQTPQQPTTRRLSIDLDKAPTTDRLVEFRLTIPDGVRNMTQHPGDAIVGSVVVTLTKPTKIFRISIQFLGRERVYLRENPPSAPIAMHAKTDYVLFDHRMALWGERITDGTQQSNGSSRHWETMAPGTHVIPFSISIPNVNYPSAIRREKICGVKYTVQAFLERPGKLTLRSTSTRPEDIVIEPIAYPLRPRDVLRIDCTIPGNADNQGMQDIAVRIQGGISKLPVVAGDRILYKLEACAVNDTGDDPQIRSLASNYTVKYMTIHIIECLELKGMIKGIERSQTHRNNVHTVRLPPNSDKQEKYSNSAPFFTTSDYIRLPQDLCPFDSKLLTRTYELRIDCEVADKTSFLNKVTRTSFLYSWTTVLDVVGVSPDKFDAAAFQNAYTDNQRNISGIVPPPHHHATAEPEIRKGGWEQDTEYIEWNRLNPTWIQLARRKYSSNADDAEWK